MKKILLFFTLIILFVGCSLTSTNNDDVDNPSNEYFRNPTPINNSTEQSTSITLSWETDENFIFYDIYFSRYSPPTTLIANNLTEKSYTKSGLSYETTYFWKVVGHYEDGTTKESPIWFFTTRNQTAQGEGLLFIDHGTTTETPNFVKMLFQAVDETGIGIQDLQTTDLEIFEDGEKISQTESYLLFEQYLANQFIIKIALVLDVSTSLREEVDQIKAEAIDFVNNTADEYHQIAIYEFSENVNLVQDFSSDVSTLESAINSIVVGMPTTDLYGATIVGAESWEENIDASTGIETGALVIFTDGTDTQGSHTLEQAISSISGKRVYTIGLGNEISPQILEQIGRNGFFSISEADELSLVFDQIRIDLEKFTKSFYWLTYASPKRGNNYHTLIVRGIASTSNSYISGSYSSEDFFSSSEGLHVNATAQFPEGIDEISLAINNSKTLEAFSFYYQNPTYNWTILNGNSLLSLTNEGENNQIAEISAGNTTGEAEIRVEDIENNLTKNILIHITN